MKLSHSLLSIAALGTLIPAASQAQTTITFETHDYAALGVYDTWTESPFRTGQLAGNVGVVDNHLNTWVDLLGLNPNASQKLLAVQRSRYGSNTFGARIDLKAEQQFELTPNERFVHVMVNRPYGGRVMVVGLGNRDDRPGQSPEAEQFWAMTTQPVPANQWQDVVLPIKGNGGITIRSLVVVPDCESPHAYTKDELCYIDNLEVNDNPSPRFVAVTPETVAEAAESHSDWCYVNDANRNGEVLTANGERLVKFKALPGKDFKIKMNPENGFTYEGIVVKFGRNLSGEARVNGKRMWDVLVVKKDSFAEDDTYTIKGKYLQQELEIEGLFIEIKP